MLNSHDKRKYKPTKAEIVAMQKDNGPRTAELVLNSHETSGRSGPSSRSCSCSAVNWLESTGRAVHPDVAGRGVEYAWARRSSSSAGTSTTLMGSTCARTFWRRWAIKRSRAPTSALTTHQCRSVAFAGLPAVRAPIACLSCIEQVPSKEG